MSKPESETAADDVVSIPFDRAQEFTFTYTNWRGETAERTAIAVRAWFGTTEWHPEPQWFLRARDRAKDEWRDFAMKDMGNVREAP